jgi:hypothetical protein
MATAVTSPIKVADEVWVAAALLQREHPHCADFPIDEIMERAAREAGNTPLRPGVYVHVVQHCVANRRPNPGRYRMLYETAPGRRRLFRTGDSYAPEREGSKIVPVRDDLPEQYRDLIDWYREWNASAGANREHEDPILGLVGAGKRLWAGESPDDYVRRLREGWE